MTAGEVAGLIGAIAGLLAALAFVLLVGFIARPLLRLGAVLEEVRDGVDQLTAHTMPVIDEAAGLVAASSVQMAKVDTVTTAAAEVSQDVAALTALVAATVGRPLIAVAAFSAGVRRAFGRSR